MTAPRPACVQQPRVRGSSRERGFGGFDDAEMESEERRDIALHLPRTPCRVTVYTHATRVSRRR